MATVTPYNVENAIIRILKIEWATNAGAAVIPDYVLTAADLEFIRGWNLFMAVTDPGSTAPTANYDITITDQYGVDVMGGQLENRSDTESEQVVPKIGGVYGGRTMDGGAVTVAWANNAVNDATGTLVLFLGR